MQKRVIFVAVMTVLLIAGMWSSAACEMTCLPQAQCCPQQMQHTQMMAHCEHAAGSQLPDHLIGQHNCNHAQDQSGAAFIAAASSVQIIPAYAVAALVLSNGSQAASAYDRTQSSLLKRPANLPLRI